MTNFLARTLCIFTFCLSASVLFAQGRPLRQAPSTLTKAVKAAHPKVPGRIFSFPHLEKLLIQRELLTRQALDKLPLAENLLLPDEKPALAVSGWPWKREPLGPYVELPFFRKLSPEAQRNYFLSANNRAIATLWKQRAALFKAIKARQNEFLTQKISNPTQEPFVQMAAQIGPEIKQVMIVYLVAARHKFLFGSLAGQIPEAPNSVGNGIFTAGQKKYAPRSGLDAAG